MIGFARFFLNRRDRGLQQFIPSAKVFTGDTTAVASTLASVGVGETEIGRSFCAPYFDENWYLARYPDVDRVRVGALNHYLEHGWRERRNPSPYFDTEFYLQTYPDVAEARIEPLQHYLADGWREGRCPNRYFDVPFYRATYLADAPDVEPLAHYISTGQYEDCRPNRYFSPAWYLQTNKDVAQAGAEPLLHYTTFGWRENRNPMSLFDVAWYLSANPDVREAQIEPLLHYMTYGWREPDRDPNPMFDGVWYRETYLKDAPRNADPLLHYIAEGAVGKNAPSRQFDPAFYRARNPDIEDEPDLLAHYLQFGRFEGRSPHPNAADLRDATIGEWSDVNASSEVRSASLARALGIPLRRSTPAEVAVSLFSKVVAGAKCVTFDIFDTLVERRSGRPETVFSLLSVEARRKGLRVANFSSIRTSAETRAREAAGRREVTLSEIYDQIAQLTDASSELCLDLAEAEIALEIALCEPKPIGLALYRAALAAGLRVALLSDIYLDRRTVEAILTKAGVVDHAGLYLSSELGATKHYGSLFTFALRDLAVEANEVVHIGDNPHSDGVVARGLGLRALLLKKSDVMVDSAVLREWYGEPPTTPASRWKAVVAGEAVRRIGGVQASGSFGRIAECSETVGATALGPVLLAFAQHVAHRARLLGYERLHFASRDGFYLKEAYDVLRSYDPSLPPSSYFLASRRVCRAASLSDFDDIVGVAEIDHFPMTARDMIRARFPLEESDFSGLSSATTEALDHLVTNSRDDAVLRGLLEDFAPAILRRGRAHAEAYRAYLGRLGLDAPGAAIVDIGYRGTIQRYVADLVGSRPGGIYFVTWPEIDGILEKGLRFDAFVASRREPSDPVVRFVQLLELFFSGTHGSVQQFAMRGDRAVASLGARDATSRTRRTLNHLRSGALAFVEDMCSHYPDVVKLAPPNGREAIAPLIEVFRHPPSALVDGLSEHRFEDTFGGEKRSLVIRPTEDSTLAEALSRSCWAEGTASLWRAARRTGLGDDVPTFDDAVDAFEDSRTISAVRRST